MKKLLIVLFLVMIIGFGIVGYSQTVSKSDDTIEQSTDNTASIQIQ
ncbi:hypothetical protein [Virgibacillus oceani]|uniref:Uncharacterized protein n=1 Tax=Virgibacillus oceani TaxID=1479511 RepID=A0A917H8H1_9BACI|nr:hypothetical protein [Virgibacillus oceani]GGG71282.1 hypothetical protein GCM10011398_14390 [Virgibacillus oceani]